jgi:Uma2 family endonuclease
MREPLIPQLDAEEFLHWENRQQDRFELHHGFIVAFAGGTIDHDTIATNVRVLLRKMYPSPCRSFGSDVKVRISESIVFYPDAGVVCEELTGGETVVTAPTAICEILSESTRTYDLIDKRAAYHGLPTLGAYIIVHTRTRRIEVDVRSPDGSWQTSTIDDGPLPLGAHTVTVDEIYEFTAVPAAT